MRLVEENDIIQQYVDYAIVEAVRHCLKKQITKKEKQEPRYLYSDAQRKMFLDLYKEKGGKPENIEINRINNDYHEFLCYSVHRV